MKKYAHIAAIVVLALIFGASGLIKLVNPGLFEEQFAKFGLPGWFVLVTGAVELSGAVLVAFGTDVRRRCGAMLLAVTMAVATLLHAVHDPLAMALPAFVLFVLTGFVALLPSWQSAPDARGAA